MTVYRHQGKWRYDFRKNGIRYRGTADTKQEAKDAEAEERKKIGKINTDFIRLCESRLEELELKRSDKHFKENESLIKKLIPLWGRKKEITRYDVESFLNPIARTHPHMANKYLRFIKSLFNHGIEREWFTYNPAGKLKPYPVKREKKYIPSREDVQAVLKLAKPLDKLYILVVIHTLGRIREVNNLKWDDVKEDYLILRTRKSKNSDLKERIVPLNDILRAVLDHLPRKGEYVFINPRTEKPYDYRDKFLTTLCKKAGVKRFTWHNLRHFAASILAEKGEALTTIQALLGHERATTTDIYLQSIGAQIEHSTRHLDIE